MVALKNKHDLFILLISIAVFAILIPFSADEEAVTTLTGQPLVQMCWVKSVTGIPCPTCGLSRSLVAWLDGRIALAWQLHPLSIFLLVPLILQIPYRLFIIFSGRRIRFFSARMFVSSISLTYVGLFLLNWLIRIVTG